MEPEKDKRFKRIGWITSILTQLLLLILFYFLIAWKEPFPPIPSYGIELSFGFEEQGRGEDIPTATPDTQADEESNESEPEETEAEVESSDKLSEPVESEQVEAQEPLTNVPGPDVVKEEPKKVEAPKNETPKPEQPKKSEPEKSEQKEEKLNPAASMPVSDSKTTTEKGETSQPGNQGKEEGTIDGRALMGEQGSSNGASLQMAGWAWDARPNPKDPSGESGKIVYRIKIDEDGYIINIELLSSTVSPVVERYYRQSVERLSFSKTNEYKAAPTSSGTITFIIQSK